MIKSNSQFKERVVSLNLICKDNRFWPLFWTQFLGALNDNFFKNALVILITFKSVSIGGMNSTSLVAMAGGVFILPFFLCSATAGQIADKYDKSAIIKIAKIAEIIVMGIAAVGFITNNFLLLMVVLFLMGAQSSFFGPLKYGIIPDLLHKDEIVTGNAYVASGTFIAILVGTIIGGLSASFEGAQTYIGIGIVCVSVIGFLFSLKVKHPPAGDKSLKVDYTFLPPTWTIMKLTMKEKDIFHTIMGVSWFWFLGASILSMLPSLVKNVFFSNADVGTIFLATFTIGMGFGGYVCDKLSGKKVEVGMVPLAAVFMSLFMFDLGYVGYTWSGAQNTELLNVSQFFASDNSIRAIFDLFIFSVFGGLFIIPQMSYIQRYSPKDIVARTIAGNNIWNSLFMVSAAAMIIVLDMFKLGPSEILGVIAGLNFLLSFYFFAIRSDETWRFICWCFCHLCYDMEVEGEDKIPEEGSVILCMNHISFIDWLMVMAISPRPVRFIIDHIFYYAPTGPFWFRQASLIPIATKKESPEILEKAYVDIADGLKTGHILGLFPEGFISRNGQMRRFQPGIKKILKHDPTIVIPVALEGLWGSFFSFSGGGPLKGFPTFKRRKIHLKVMDPIKPEDFDLHDLEDKIHAHMSIKSLVIEERKQSGLQEGE